MQHLGVLGGTFDPVHQGHIRLAKYAMEKCNLSGVLLAPASQPPHKGEVFASPRQRLHMCRLAVKNEENIQVTDADLQDKTSYTVSLIKRLRKTYPEASFSFIMGADKLENLPNWKNAEELFSLCDFICYPRENINPWEALEKVRRMGAKVTMLEGNDFEGASSDIRKALSAWQDVQEVCPDVLEYIGQKNIYQENFLPKLKGMMNSHRFEHTLGVRDTAMMLAKKYGAPVLKTGLAALLHDCAKGMASKDMRKIAVKHHLTDNEEILSSGALLHGLVGAQVAKDEFGIEDEDVLNAIRNHTIGRENMSVMELCVFVADAIEPNREMHDGLKQQRELAQVSLKAAALASLYGTKSYVESQGKTFFEGGQKTLNDLERNLTDKEKQLLLQA